MSSDPDKSGGEFQKKLTAASAEGERNKKKSGGAFSSLARLPRVLSAGEKTIIKLLVVLIAISGIALGIRAIVANTTVVPQEGGKYVEGVVAEPQFINPLFADSADIDKSITSLAFRGLMQYDKDLQLTTDLAEKFEQSEDKKEYLFTLKQGQLWHDHEKQEGNDKYVTADDVVFTIQAMQDVEYGSPLRLNFEGIRVEEVDDYTVKFTLEEEFAPFLGNLTVGILPKHIWETVTPLNAAIAEANLQPIGSGPFEFDQLQKDRLGVLKSFTLKRFEDYTEQRPNLDTIEFRFYEDSDLLVEAYDDGEIDGVNIVLPNFRDSLVDARDIELHSMNLSTYQALFFNQVNSKPLQDIKVREALSHATDREELIDEALDGQGGAVYGPILPGFLGFNPELRTFEFDREAAENTLHEAGWIDTNGNDVRDKNGQELEFTLRTADFPELVGVAELLQKQWAQIGAKLVIEDYDANVLQQRFIKERDYEILLFGEIVGHDPDPYVFWHSSQRKDPGLNLTSFKNESVDNLLDEARKTDDVDQRTIKYLNFQNIVADEIPAIFLFAPAYVYGLDPDVKGFDVETIATPSERFLNVEEWFVKSDRVWGRSDS